MGTLDQDTVKRLHDEIAADTIMLRWLAAEFSERVFSICNALTTLTGVNDFLASQDWRWPLDPKWNTVTQRFGNPTSYGKHEGVDISVPEHHTVYAPHSGTVISAKFNSAYGNRIRIEWMTAGERWWTWLCHLSNMSVKEGDIVLAGLPVGLSGNTGNSTGPHLHWNVQRESDKTLLVPGTPVLTGCIDPLGIVSIP